MRIVARTLIGLCALALSGWPLEGFGGVLIVEKTTTGDGAAQTHHVQIDKDWMRMEQPMGGDKQAFIFDAVKQVVWIVNHDKQTYQEMTKADVERMGAQTAEAMAKLQEAMKNMNPQQQAMMEAMLKGQGMTAGGPVQRTVYKKVGADRVGKWTCDKYEGYLNEQKTSELCTVEPAALGLVEADFEVARKMGEFFKRLVPRNADNMFNLGKPDEQGFSGVPVRRTFWVGQRQTTTEMSEISRQTFPPSTWEVPAGFRKQALGQGGGGGGSHKGH